MTCQYRLLCLPHSQPYTLNSPKAELSELIIQNGPRLIILRGVNNTLPQQLIRRICDISNRHSCALRNHKQIDTLRPARRVIDEIAHDLRVP